MSQPQMSEEQQKALMEKLKNMSPEELREFQKKQCIFCQIAAEKMQAKKVYEDEKAIAILDINPASAGHILLLPKEHYSIMPQLPAKTMEHLGILAKKLSHVLLKSVKATGTTIFIANGAVAGQRAQHFMIHIIPRHEKDAISFFVPQQEIREGELEGLRKMIAEKLGMKKSSEKSKEKAQIKKEVEKKDGKKKKGEEQKQVKSREKANESISLDDIAGLFK